MTVIEADDLMKEIMAAMDTCPSNPSHIIMNRTKFDEIKAWNVNFKKLVFSGDINSEEPPKIMGLRLIVSDGVDRMYCGKLIK